MRMSGNAVVALLAATAGMALVGCGPGDPSTSSPVETASSKADTGTPASDRQSPAVPKPTGEDTMKIVITVNGQRFRATLADSAASRDLLAQLPQTVEMTDHGGVEKTGPLLTPLTLDGQPAGADPDVGDLGYYSPGQDLVLYYGNQAYFPGIVILGRLDGDAAREIAEIPGRVTATLTEG
jgi:hypothetical protein